MSKLPNYLRASRKRLALSQDDVAFLLGVECGAKVCRYERFARVPNLECALACEVIFQRPASELFAGLYQKIERQIAKRAESLLQKTNTATKSQQTKRKQSSLAAISTPKAKK
jgi:DNA-binding XRE family transcriptional regulator